MAASPIYFDGRVIQVCDAETESYMYAAAETGEILWRNERLYALRGFSTPVLYELAGFDVETGAKKWFVQALTR